MEEILRKLDEAMSLIKGVMETLDPERKPGQLRLTRREIRDAEEAFRMLKEAGIDLPLDLIAQFYVVGRELEMRGYEVTVTRKKSAEGAARPA